MYLVLGRSDRRAPDVHNLVLYPLVDPDDPQTNRFLPLHVLRSRLWRRPERFGRRIEFAREGMVEGEDAERKGEERRSRVRGESGDRVGKYGNGRIEREQ